MASRSEQIRERLFEVVYNGEMENSDLVKIFEYIGNDILQLKTKSNYSKGKKSKITGRDKTYLSWKWAKGERTNINGIMFISDNE